MQKSLDSLSASVRDLALDDQVDLDRALNLVIDQAVESETLNVNDELAARIEIKTNLEGFGFLQPYLEDESVEEIWINRPGELWIAKAGVHQRLDKSFSADQLRSLVERLIRFSGRRLDRSTPFIDAQLESGFRLHAVVPDITRQHLSLNIRKFSNQILGLSDLVGREMLTSEQAAYLSRELRAGANLLISGATQAGKTTLLTALLGSLDQGERVVSVEDTFELRCLLPDWVAMQTRPASLEGKHEVDLRRLVRESLRMRPTRLVVGEVRGAEALDLLIAMNSGIPGLCTIHANSNEEALKKLSTLPLLAGGNISSAFIESLIQTSMKILVHCSRTPLGYRSVSSIMQVSKSGSLRLEPVTF